MKPVNTQQVTAEFAGLEMIWVVRKARAMNPVFRAVVMGNGCLRVYKYFLKPMVVLISNTKT